ncbi:MAG: GGDEF domain-containing protein [Ruminococcus sp.]|nr:GGDEF domain-containing protein [Ruminococcus sp.]
MIDNYKIAALCVSRIFDDSTHEIVSELNKNIIDKGYRLFVYHTCSDLYWDTLSEKGEAAVFDLIDMRTVDVLIICDDMIKNKRIIEKLIDKAGIFDVPVIIIDGKYRGTITIGFDYRKGFEDVVRHVVEFHGKRKLHFMAGIQGNPYSDERIRVFAKVLKDNGIPFDPTKMLSYGDFWAGPASAATEKLLERGELPEAIICANDAMAIAVCGALSNAGVRVPDEVIVTGFDGIMDINFTSPRITSSLCCYGDLAQKIAGLLSLGREELMKETEFRIKTRLAISESCGCRGSGLINPAMHLTDLNTRFYRYREEEKTLNEIGVRILSGTSLKSAANELRSPILYNMRCMLRNEVIDERIDPFETDSDRSFGETLCVFFDSDAPGPFAPHDFPAKSIIPGLDEVLEAGYPLIITAISFLDVPLGYVTFSFRSYDISNYGKIPQVVNVLNNSIGGYRNLRYQQYIIKKVEELSQFDQLTGLYTRGGSQRVLDRLISKLRDQRRPITVIMSDLDNLKYINDNFGHNEGDFAIRAVASALKASCPDNSVCIRMGGDEMAAFIATSAPMEDIKAEFEARLKTISKNAGKPYPITASIGVYRSSKELIPSFEEMLRSADEIMYAVKAEHRKNRDKLISAAKNQ